MTLLEFQRTVAAGIMAPLGKPTDAQRSAAGLIARNDRLTALERLEIYRRSYWYRILDSLRDDFPGLCAIVGKRAFHRLSQAYLRDRPSQSFTLRDLGASLENWLAANPEFAGPKHALALDMVRLEWAHIEAFDGRAEKPLEPEDLAGLGPETGLHTQPHLSLLALSFPVDDLRIRVQGASGAGRDAASDSALRRKERALVREYGRPRPEAVFLAVHRIEYTVYYRRIEEGEFRILSALREGLPLAEAAETAPDSAEKIQTWFASWSRLGWLCKEPNKQSKPILPGAEKIKEICQSL